MSTYSNLTNIATTLADTSYLEYLQFDDERLEALNNKMIQFTNHLEFIAKSDHLDMRQELRVCHNLMRIHTRDVQAWLAKENALEQLGPSTKRQKLESPPTLVDPARHQESGSSRGPFQFPALYGLLPQGGLLRQESMGPPSHRFLEGMLSPNHEVSLIRSIEEEPPLPPLEEQFPFYLSDSDSDETTLLDYNVVSEDEASELIREVIDLTNSP